MKESEAITKGKSSPWNVDLFVPDGFDQPSGDVEDGVLVGLDGLGCVDDKSDGRVEHLLVWISRLWTQLALAVAQAPLLGGTQGVWRGGRWVTVTGGREGWETQAILEARQISIINIRKHLRFS